MDRRHFINNTARRGRRCCRCATRLWADGRLLVRWGFPVLRRQRTRKSGTGKCQDKDESQGSTSDFRINASRPISGIHHGEEAEENMLNFKVLVLNCKESCHSESSPLKVSRASIHGAKLVRPSFAVSIWKKDCQTCMLWHTAFLVMAMTIARFNSYAYGITVPVLARLACAPAFIAQRQRTLMTTSPRIIPSSALPSEPVLQTTWINFQ